MKNCIDSIPLEQSFIQPTYSVVGLFQIFNLGINSTKFSNAHSVSEQCGIQEKNTINILNSKQTMKD